MANKKIEDNRTTKQRLDDAEKVVIMVQPSSDDKQITVTINGETYRVPRGILVEVPKPIAQIISQSYQATIESKDRLSEYTSAQGKNLS